jgi:hypothetical protein
MDHEAAALATAVGRYGQLERPQRPCDQPPELRGAPVTKGCFVAAGEESR